MDKRCRGGLLYSFRTGKYQYTTGKYQYTIIYYQYTTTGIIPS